MPNPGCTSELEDLKYCSGHHPELGTSLSGASTTQDATTALQRELAAMGQQLELIISGQDLLTSGQARLQEAIAMMLSSRSFGATPGADLMTPKRGQEFSPGSPWAAEFLTKEVSAQKPKPPPLLFSGCTGMTVSPIVAAPDSARTEVSCTPRSKDSGVAFVNSNTQSRESLGTAPQAYISPFDTFETDPVKDKLERQRPAGMTRLATPESHDLAVTMPVPSSPNSARRSTISAKQGKVLFARRRARLLRVFEVNERVEAEQMSESETLAAKQDSSRMLGIKGTDTSTISLYLDSVMSVVIAANAIFIGINIDYGSQGLSPGFDHPLQVIDVIFTITFVLEIIIKLVLHGFREHFCGRDRKMNIFDTVLIVVDSAQVTFKLADPATMKKIPSASLFRVVRLVRLVRLLRLLRTSMFKDLLAMLQGLGSGASTLLWAVLLFGMMVYVTSLVCREFYGRPDEEFIDPDSKVEVEQYFETVPRSMFTIFRCSFGDCSALGGVPIPEHITKRYGGLSALGYCFFIFMMTIGLFNVISAIFVDSTMTAAAEHALRKRQDRLNDEKRWAASVCGIIKKLAVACPEHNINPDGLLAQIDKIVTVEFSRNAIDEVINSEEHEHNQEVKGFLDDLDIDPQDHKRLADILDPDHSGTIGMLELVEGLRRLRGEPRRSDVVSVDLMVRAMQERLEEVFDRVVELRQHQERKLGKLNHGTQVRRLYDV